MDLWTPAMSDTAADRLELAAGQLAGTLQTQAQSARRRRLVWLAAAGILLLAILGRRWLERTPPAPPAPSPTQSVVFVDTEGWYGRSSQEVAVASPVKLGLDDLPAGLPLRLGPWEGRDRPPDPEVTRWFDSPEVVIQRTYTRADGERVWLSAFGSRGPKSFHLFEHVPDLCYPLGGWQIDQFGLARLPLGSRPLPVNHGIASGPEGELVFLYLYVWDSPARDPERGTLSLRIAAPVTRTAEATFAMLAQDFIPQLFSRTLSWNRF